MAGPSSQTARPERFSSNPSGARGLSHFVSAGLDQLPLTAGNLLILSENELFQSIQKR